MLVQNLAVTYKCYSSIGNSLNLKEMIGQTLKTFVSETYAIFGSYVIPCEKNKKILKELCAFGKIDNFEPNNFNDYQDKINLVTFEDRKIVIIRLDYGSIFLITKNLTADCSFFLSMFESFINKLNLSVHACLNVEKMQKANELLKKQKQDLKIANKAKDDFLANMSHELKTPLNSINIISSVMKKNKDNSLNEKQIKNLEIINSCGNYLLTLINDVLDISKLEAGRINVNYSKINLHDLLKEIYDMFLPQVLEKNAQLNFSCDSTIEFIYSDDNKIKQIVKNILSNALKFVHEGVINLKVKDEDNYVTIIVEDNGIGIPDDKMEHIFDRFKQVDDSTTRKYGGTGLGLAICKELLNLLNGTIHLKSQLGVGSTFYITIPKNLDSLESMDLLDFKHRDEIIEELMHDKDSNNKKRVLIYNTSAVKFFKIVMELQKKFKVIQAFSKTELDNLSTNDVDTIIVDVDTIHKDEIENIISNYSERLVILTKDNNLKLSNELNVRVALKDQIEELTKII